MSIDKAREILACRFGLTIAQDVEAFVDAKLDARLSPAPVGGETMLGAAGRVWEASIDPREPTSSDPSNPYGVVKVPLSTPPPAEPDCQHCFGTGQPGGKLGGPDHGLCSWCRGTGKVPTPPPAEPDGGGVREPSRIAHDLRWLRGQLMNDIADGYDPPITPDGHGVIDTIGEAIEALTSIADLEQRLAETERQRAENHKIARTYIKHEEARRRERDEARATIAERDRRIAYLEAGLELAANRIDLLGVGLVPGSLPYIQAGEWVEQARALLSPATDKGGV